MIEIPYWARVLALLALAAAMVVYDRRKGATVRQWEYGCLLLSGIVGAVYGAANDAVTVSLSPEYFAVGKGLGFGPSLKLHAVQLGAEAGFSAAVIACAVWQFSLRHSPAPRRCRLIACAGWLPLACAGLFATFAGLLFSRLDPLDFTLQLADVLDGSQARAFVTVWWVHLGTYLGLILGLAGGITLTRRHQDGKALGVHGRLASSPPETD